MRIFGMSPRQARSLERYEIHLSIAAKTPVIQTNRMKSHHFFQAAGSIGISCLLSSFTLLGQTTPKPDPQGLGGVVTGTPVNYTSKRTAGITDAKAPLIFEDATDKTALSNFTHHSGT